ncbi:MAG: serine/threonine protein kinase [Bdellovibrionia bacterium]
MADGPKKFGRYFLLDLLAQGGMAEIYRARLASADGAGRVIVIKRIQSGHGADQEFIQMFRSEIKVTMGFNHPNIVQLYDFGEENSQPYIAMEWVDGKNLRQLMARFHELKQRFPVDLAVQIIEQAACGLNYAHHFKDKITGNALNIVHRDISPQNLIISFEGSVKVIDFGIAKASVNSEATRAGVIKGKPSYLSPEQINGDALDGRSDIFSLGTVLWELLAGKKLFSGDSDLAILKQIESCNTHVKPPSTINPDVPPELDYIVLRSLAKHRDKRYQTAEEFQRALHKFLYAHTPEFNPSDLAYYAKDLFKNEIVEDRKKIQKLNDEVERLMSSMIVAEAPLAIEGFGSAMNPSSSKVEKEGDSTMIATKAKPGLNIYEAPLNGAPIDVVPDDSIAMTSIRRNSTPMSNGSFTTTVKSRSVQFEKSRQMRSSPKKSGGGFAGIAAALALVVGGAFFFGKDLKLPFMDGIQVVKSTHTGERNPGSLGSLGSLGSVGSVGSADGSQTSADPATKEASNPHRAKDIVLKLNLTPGGGSPLIKLNGQSIDPDRAAVRVPMDTLLELSVERRGYKAVNRQFFIESSKVGDLGQWNMDVQLEPSEFGTLYISTTPSAEAMILMDGKPWVKNTPFDKEIMLPVGTYLVQMTNKGLGMGKTIKVSIERNKSLRLEDIHLDDLEK